MEYLPEPSVTTRFGMGVDEVIHGPSWMDPITAFLSTWELPIDEVEERRIKYKVEKYHLVNDVLYKRGYDLPYLRCVHPRRSATSSMKSIRVLAGTTSGIGLCQ